MSQIPDEFKYSKDHEWIRIEGNEATIGITDYAQNELTDVIFVELPEVNKSVKKGEIIGVVESVKSVAEMFSPFNGQIKEVNNELESNPELINQEPYGKGWIAILSISDLDEVGTLISSEEYRKHVGE